MTRTNCTDCTQSTDCTDCTNWAKSVQSVQSGSRGGHRKSAPTGRTDLKQPPHDHAAAVAVVRHILGGTVTEETKP
jgi:hypothetical protein